MKEVELDQHIQHHLGQATVFNLVGQMNKIVEPRLKSTLNRRKNRTPTQSNHNINPVAKLTEPKRNSNESMETKPNAEKPDRIEPNP